ncbi:nuclear pore complex protein Nup205 [Toxorhynchites rutilus septentrionalis]|uniref:nuclear pore complex protein Nup205 n=1 Tax=Toxorhynchites rutilus septentrionalis TaxID=329112 RepID=UPI0024799938|nr:nuclear pore complex protein Nup205 [Toxorhynchites rutilus septentrionalis]
MTEATPDDMWTPFKHLFNSIEVFLAPATGGAQQQEQNVASLDVLLRKHKQNFTSLLRNPPKNAKSREAIRQGITEGITLPEFGHTILSKDLVDESVIISDMYSLNEYIALELLCTAQQQMPNHPGLPRGLVAVLLYYDGRKSLAASLKELFQARAGISWCTDAPYEITQLITSYTDGLVADGILDKIVDLLEELDVTKELDVLTTNRALGPPKHHRQVLELFEEIRLLLATSLFNWAAQCGLPKGTTVKLIRHLAKYKSTVSSGGIDDVTMAMQMALMYGLDMSVIQRREDGEEVVRRLPMVKDAEFIETVMEALSGAWECEGLRSVSLFTFGLAIATIRLAPQNLYSNTARIIDQDELLVDAAIQGRVFDFIHYTLLENEIIFRTEFYYRRMHVLFTDFIELMHSKVTELRARADETARTVQAFQQQGLDPPANLCRNFEALLLSVGKLYQNDNMRLNLSLEYWGPMEVAANYQRASSRSVCLFKFIRLAGELLPPILFIPYLKMLSGLSSSPQSARNAFNLLKQGGASGASATISWDHFFNSLFRYYQNLRQEQNPGSETVYRNRAMSRNINPQEIAGLQAVLQVIRAVATYDEVARVALCEHPNWAPLHVLLGLISCSVAIPLKADLVQTLAALGKSKETALQLWSNLEASQIISTIPTTSTFASRGIESELEEIESRNELYPLTIAMLDLLYILCDTAIPKGLGAGPRKPGLDPYVTFVIDAVFLRFYNRNYKNPAEKWQIAEKCLQLLYAFVRNYVPSPADFPSTIHPQEENSSPGFHILLQVNTKSDFLRLLLHIIDESCTMFDSYAPFAGKKHLEATSLYALQIIERALETQEDFFSAHFSSNCSILLAGINKLLLGMNPRSGKADHMLNVTRFVTYNSWLPENALVAIRVLTAIMRQPNVNQQILGLFTQNERVKNEIRQGFVECLESEAVTYAGAGGSEADSNRDGQELYLEGEEGSNGSGANVELHIKEAIIGLLQECLPQQSTPNLAHYLLGFELSKELRLTNLQQPGVMNFPSNCGKSLITLLDNSLEVSKSGKTSSAPQERLIENAYSLLYALCHNTRTSEVILRFLRSCNDFLCRHISGLPFANVKSPHVLNQMTGLLKCVAIELKLTSDKSQVSQFGNVCKILLGVVQSGQQAATESAVLPVELSHHYSMMNASMMSSPLESSTIGGGGRKGVSESAKLLLCQLLDCLDFEIKSLEKPKWDYFDNSLLQGLLQSCEIPAVGAGGGLKLIDIRKLHDVLKDELNSVQTTIAAGQRAHILVEIETILMYGLQVNCQRNLCASTVKFLEGWSQVTEVLFSVTPAMFVSLDVKQSLLLEIVQAVLSKVVPNQIMPELANLASSTVLLLMVNMRHCCVLKNREGPQEINQGPLMSSFGGNSVVGVGGSGGTFSPKTNTLSLRYILQNILEWILISGVGSQKLRINLYASLLNYMHIVKGNRDKLENEQDNMRDEFYVSRLDKSLAAGRSHESGADESQAQIEMVIEIFQSFGDKLIDILCHDCTGGHDICKMLALSCVDMLLDMDSMTNVIQFISKRGYLSHMIDSLLKNDVKLCRILDNQPENMKALYVYESKMAMLSRIGSSHIGAELLLEEKALSVLAGMKVFDLHPDFQVLSYSGHYQASSSFIPPIEARYQQILFPALNLCDVILSTLGQENHSAVTQIIHFLLSHGETIEIVLRAGTPFLNIGLLQELAGITSLIARAANQEISTLIAPNVNQDIGANLYRLQKLMLTLFPRFSLSEQTLKELNQNALTNCSEREKSTHLKYFLQIAANLALYARNSISNHAVDHRTINVLFSPQISENIHHRQQENRGTGAALETSHSLNIIVVQLKNSVEYYHREKLSHESLVRQRNSLPSLSLDTNVQVQHNNLTERIAAKQEELKRCVFITEHCLYLLWAHLDYFMLRAIPVSSLHFNSSYGGGTENYLSSQTEVGWKITAEDVAALKKTLIGVFNETFCKQLVSTVPDQTRTSDKGFIEALLRRIKRLIQFVPVK